MNGILSWWDTMWPQVLPNLIASLLWAPLAGAALLSYRRWMKRHAQELAQASQHLAELHRRLDGVLHLEAAREEEGSILE